MSFEPVDRRHWHRPAALSEGEAGLQRGGTMTVLAADLELVAIGDAVRVLVDRGGLRIGLRAPAPDEAAVAFRVSPVRVQAGKRDTGRRRVNLRPAIVALNLDPRVTAGRYALKVQGNMLLVDLTTVAPSELRAIDGQGHGPGKRRAGAKG